MFCQALEEAKHDPSRTDPYKQQIQDAMRKASSEIFRQLTENVNRDVVVVHGYGDMTLRIPIALKDGTAKIVLEMCMHGPHRGDAPIIPEYSRVNAAIFFDVAKTLDLGGYGYGRDIKFMGIPDQLDGDVDLVFDMWREHEPKTVRVSAESEENGARAANIVHAIVMALYECWSQQYIVKATFDASKREY